MDFYSDTDPWNFETCKYPTWDDCMHYYMSRINKFHQKTIINHLAEAVEKIWKSGDGCPKSISSIRGQFENHVLATYQKYRRGDTVPRSRQKKPGTPAPSPSRRSGRSAACTTAGYQGVTPTAAAVPHTAPITDPTPAPAKVQTPAPATLPTPASLATTSQPLVSKRKEGKERRESWMKDHGQKLFDVFSEIAMVAVLKEGRCFDSDFYEDQGDPDQRKLVIETVRVRKEFVEAEQNLSKTKANKFARVLSALGQSTVVRDYCDTLPEIPEDDREMEKSPFKAPKEAVSNTDRSSILTRQVKRSLSSMLDSNKNIISVPSVATSLGNLSNKSTQTESHCLDDVSVPSISTRKKPSRAGAKQSTLCHEAYLQAGLLMCAVGNQSPSQAVLNMMIIDTQVYKQKRLLPLAMQKKYQLELKKIKKLRASMRRKSTVVAAETVPESSNSASANNNTEGRGEHCVEKDREVEIYEDSDDEQESVVEISESDSEETVIFETEFDQADDIEKVNISDAPPPKKSKLEVITDFVSKTKANQKQNLDQVLPDPRSIRRAHHLAGSYLEGEIGSLMVKDGKTFLMPDGTSRAKVGKMGATLVSIEGKMRALKLQSMGNEQRSNWADTIIHQLQRLSVASGESTSDLYKSICCLVSDSCKVNKGLAAMMSAKLGLEWVPGQLYCLIHSVLGFQDGVCNTWLKYQEEMGHDKLYPSITGFELDVEDKGLIKQIMEMYLRLTADRWQARSWNKFEEFTIFCTERGMRNVGQELHGNRFGELEKCCAIAVYSLPTWKDFISSYPNIRNQLAIFLRDTVHLSDMCNFLWLGGALLGLHLTEPYLFLILEMNVSHNDLLTLLPKLYEELSTYPKSLAQLKEPGLPSLSEAWLDPLSKDSSPYGVDIANGVLQAIDLCDRQLLDKYLKDLCFQMSVVLKRQRGDAYNFGDNPDSEELVTKQLPTEDLERAPTHTKDIENLFGIQDSILTRFGAQVFNKSTDDLIIKYSQDLLGNKYEWNTTKMKKKVKEMDKVQQEFDAKQKALIDAGVAPADAILITSENKIQRVVDQCRRSHGGPVSEESEVENIVMKFWMIRVKYLLSGWR